MEPPSLFMHLTRWQLHYNTNNCFDFMYEYILRSVRREINEMIDSGYFLEDEFSDIKCSDLFDDPNCANTNCRICNQIDSVKEIKFVSGSCIQLSEFQYKHNSFWRLFGTHNYKYYYEIKTLGELMRNTALMVNIIRDRKLCWSILRSLFKWFILNYHECLHMFDSNSEIKNLIIDYVC